jgi:hypothetical protein
MPNSFLVVDDSKLHHQMYKVVFSRGPLAGSTRSFRWCSSISTCRK